MNFFKKKIITLLKQLVKQLTFTFNKLKMLAFCKDQQASMTNKHRLRHTMEEALIHTKSLGFHPDFIIDVGAADGTPPLLNVFPSSYFYFFEPLKEFENSLKALSKRFKSSHFPCALGDQEGFKALNVHPDLVGSSLLNEVDGEEWDGKKRTIQVKRLDEILDPELLLNQKGLLKIDVQGAEISVLRGATDILKNIDVIVLEVSFFKFFKQGMEFFEIMEFMKKLNYVVYDIVDGINRPLDEALAQKDFIFVKEKGFFRKSHRWATDEQRSRAI